MKYIAILGFGVVGGGIPAVIENSQEKIRRTVGDDVKVKYILDLRDFPDSPYSSLIVHDIGVILEDSEVSLVCETMGGAHPAYEFTRACFEAGKSVVTSNKELVSLYGDELFRCAAANDVFYQIEACVGGGIPVIRAFNTSLAGEELTSVSGIVNGTTNYILTRMKNAGLSFADALGEAQRLGFAEKDPSADIDGIDAQRKIIILAALATGTLLSPDDVYTESLRSITPDDIESAHICGGELKLIAQADISYGSALCCVSPMIVPSSSVLASVSDVFNGIAATGKSLGEVMFIGRGAGRMATAAAVFADACAVLSGAAAHERIPEFTRGTEHTEGAGTENYLGRPHKWCVRAEAGRTELADILSTVGDVTVVSDEGGVVRAVVSGVSKLELDALLARLPGASALRFM